MDSTGALRCDQETERLRAEWEIDWEDLGNVYARTRIQSCNACASTVMALCVSPSVAAYGSAMCGSTFRLASLGSLV